MKNTDIILKNTYKYIEKIISEKKYMNNLKIVISNFMNQRNEMLFDTCPCDRISFSEYDIDEFRTKMNIDFSKISEDIGNTYYGEVKNFNPIAAKDEFTISMMCIIRYLYLTKSKELPLVMNYLAFSGKFYPSVHYGFFQKFPPSEYRYVMEYVVNNKLTNKFDLKSKGSVYKAVESICQTWIETYGNNKMKDFEDDDVVYLIQQLHDRIKSFMNNIASLYYESYKNREYLTYDSDNFSEDDYHMADNDTLISKRIVEEAMNKITTRSVDYNLCKISSNVNVKTEELKFIIECILEDSKNLSIIEELLLLMVTDYMLNSKNKDPKSLEFITYTTSPKPNSKDPNVIRIKEILELLLSENSPAYRRRRSRLATQNNYHRAFLSYFAWVINS